MYQVLYRKYRPRFFADVIGQPQVTATLKNELISGKIAHAYLFTGSRGTGKTTCAKIFAKAVNCLHPQNGDPCGECEMCRGLDNGSVLDVLEIDAASNNGVDSIRALIEESNFTPATAKYRVYIIDEVHMLSVAAFNALLKTLEEPPAHVIFILATTEVHKLLPTILSRCQRFDFKRITPEEIAGRLLEVAEKENATIEHDAAMLLARLADGAMRDALSLMDQCLGRSSDITVEVVNAATGIAGQEHLYGLVQAVADADIAKALELIDSLYQGSKDMNRLCEEMAEYFRNLMIIKTTRSPEKLLSVSEKELEEMTNQAVQASLSFILHGLDTFEKTLNKMKYANQRTELEMAFVRLCSPELDSTPEALLRRIEALERRGVQTPVSAPTEPESAKAEIQARDGTTVKPPVKTPSEIRAELKAEVSTPAPFIEAPESSVQAAVTELPVQPQAPPSAVTGLPAAGIAAPEQVKPPKNAAGPAGAGASFSIEALSDKAERFTGWPEILDSMKQYSTSVAAAFNSSRAYVSGDYILIDAPQLAFDLLKRPSQRDRMRDEIRRVTGRTYKLGPYKKPQKEAEAQDPLDGLQQRAEEAGIDIEIKE